MITTLIVAADLDDCIGKDISLPWHLPSDLGRFKRMTTGHDVIMGQRTSASILARSGRSLPGRRSLIISHRRRIPGDNTRYFQSPAEVVEWLTLHGTYNADGEAFVIGGAQIYQALLEMKVIDRILLTRVHTRVENGDTFMPQNWLGGFMLTEAEPAMLRGEKDQFETSYTTYERFKRG